MIFHDDLLEIPVCFWDFFPGQRGQQRGRRGRPGEGEKRLRVVGYHQIGNSEPTVVEIVEHDEKIMVKMIEGFSTHRIRL